MMNDISAINGCAQRDLAMLNKLTVKQTSVLTTLYKHNSFSNADHTDKMDLDQLIDAVPYEVSKQAIQFTLRSLHKRGYIKKADDTQYRRGRMRVLWFITEAGEKLIRRV